MIIHESVCRCNGKWCTHSYTKGLVVYISAKFRLDKIIVQDKSGELNQEWSLGHLGLSEEDVECYNCLVSMFG